MDVPRWLRIVLVFGLAVLASTAGLLAWRFYNKPTTFSVATGSVDGEALKVVSAIASRLAATNAKVRLKVADTGTAVEAAKAFADGKVDLAVVRADASGLSEARTVVTLTNGVAMILVPANSGIDSIEKLRGKTVGVVAGDVNASLVQALDREYDFTGNKIHFKNLPFTEVADALKAKQVSAILIVLPVTTRYVAMARAFFGTGPKQHPGIIGIDSAGAIAVAAPAYESYDLPKGSLRGSPPVPDDDLTTLRVPVYLVAKKSLGDDQVIALTKSVIDTRRELVSTLPILGQIASPSTDKDAFIPMHSGAATYFNGDEQSFLDEWGNALFYGPWLLGGLVSAILWGWKFAFAKKPGTGPLRPLEALAPRIRGASTEDELAAIQEEIDAILLARLSRYGENDDDAKDATALSVLAQRLEQLIQRRKGAFSPDTAPVSSSQAA
jgi:TRAP transporter TAXI family solute receptor